ncbi:sensor histidine kinase [Acetobacter lambici]|uniref:histidine kinase n=2 Tax=Acetobacter lambici TaxID=1332824 RepID=A0ABT1F3W5_9PROT|nr:sensor histidine kinase [Acetobacter lambici]MCP1242673.1 sensor histidine kinase [Acetobacter lambici]MCP1258838.1 sensor histidine kinase [Acetobacter lambici]
MSVFSPVGQVIRRLGGLLMSGLGRVFITTSARMRVLICLSGIPVLSIGAVLALRNYQEVRVGSAQRAVAAIMRLDQQFRHDTDRLRSALETIGNMDLTHDQIVHALRLAETISGQRYCFLAVLDEKGQKLDSVSPSGRSCAEVGTLTPPARINATVMEAVQKSGGGEDNGAFLRITVPAAFLAEPEAHGYLVGILQISRTRAYLGGASGWEAFSDDTNPVQAWLLMHDGELFPVCTNCNWEQPPPDLVFRLKEKLEKSDRSVVSLPSMQGGYALGGIGGGADIFVSTQRTPIEADALRAMVFQIAALLFLLAAGLVGVTLAANIVLVWPLRRLTYSVRKWQMEGVFDGRVTRTMPLELQRLGQAFTRATQRLSRHEARLKKAMAHQELLMKEIHHRVKNNLQIVASLLNLQANQIAHPEVKAEFALARDRIRALATLHRTLYAEDSLTSLNMAVFLKDLCEQTFHVAGEADAGRISLQVESDSFWMDPDQAVPLALIVTEVVTNSIKYAFPDGRMGVIHVRLTKNGNLVTLSVGDNGIGCSFDPASGTQGIGLKLIHGFARQLKASLSYSGKDGVLFTLVMHMDKAENP